MKKSYINTIYNPQRRPFTSYPQQLASEILTRFNLRSGSSLLDFGCGRGEMSSAFDNIGFKVISCDRESVLTLNTMTTYAFVRLILRLVLYHSKILSSILSLVSQLLSILGIR